MATAKVSKWEKAHKRNLAIYEEQIAQLYDIAAQETAKLASLIGTLDDKPFEWKNYPLVKKKIEDIITTLASNLNFSIANGIKTE